MLSQGLPLHTAVQSLRALGETTRLRIVNLLSLGELTVTELTQVLGQSQPRVSRHLKLLLDAGLVERFSEGSWVFYRLPDELLRSGSGFVHTFSEELDQRDPSLAGDRDRLEGVKEARATRVRTYFEANAADWIRVRGLYQPVAEIEAAMGELLGPRQIEFLVDLGTGTGRVLEALSPLYRRAVGFDVNPTMLRVARVNLDRARIQHAYVRYGNLLSLPRFTERPDAVVIHQVLHYLDNPSTAIDAAAKLLAPGGRLLIVDFAPHELEFLRSEHAHRRLGFTEAEVQAWCRQAGLETRTVRRISPPADTNRNPSTPAVVLWLAHAQASVDVARGLRIAT